MTEAWKFLLRSGQNFDGPAIHLHNSAKQLKDRLSLWIPIPRFIKILAWKETWEASVRHPCCNLCSYRCLVPKSCAEGAVGRHTAGKRGTQDCTWAIISRELSSRDTPSTEMDRIYPPVDPKKNENLEGCVQNESNQKSCIMNYVGIPQMLKDLLLR